MAAGITARQYTNNAVFSEGTTFFEVTPNAVPGTAEDLVAMAVAEMGSLPSSILVSNGSAATVWIKPAVMAAAVPFSGMGVAISSLGSMFFPITNVPEGGIYIETPNPAEPATSIIAIGFE